MINLASSHLVLSKHEGIEDISWNKFLKNKRNKALKCVFYSSKSLQILFSLVRLYLKTHSNKKNIHSRFFC